MPTVHREMQPGAQLLSQPQGYPGSLAGAAGRAWVGAVDRGGRRCAGAGAVILVPIRTAPGLNARENWRARSRRVKAEHMATGLMLAAAVPPVVPCSVLLTRCAPSNGLDDDNLAGALKGVRDAVAKWLGVDDRDRARVRYRYAQRRAAWGVEITFGAPVVGDSHIVEFGQ